LVITPGGKDQESGHIVTKAFTAFVALFALSGITGHRREWLHQVDQRPD
jgi:hypothetical protein